MNESIIQTIFFFIFVLILSIFIIKKRKKIEVQWLIKNVLYLALYKTKKGLKLMDKIAQKFKFPLQIVSYVSVFSGFVGMLFISYLIIKNVIEIILNPQAQVAAGIVLPLPIKGVFYVPFFYWIISIFVLAFVHEMSHGIYARLNGIRVKSSGFAFLCFFLPIIPAAFVEPDEKKLSKAKKWAQLSVFSAGPFANIILGIFIMLIFNTSLNFLHQNNLDYVMQFHKGEIVELIQPKIVGYLNLSNVTSPAKLAGIPINSTIYSINGIKIRNIYDLNNVIKEIKHENISLNLDGKLYKMKAKRIKNRIFLGVKIKYFERIKKHYFTAVILSLLFWLMILNIGVGLFNLLPIYILDGGRMLYVFLTNFLSKEKAKKVYNIISLVFLILVLIIVFIPFLR